MRIVVVKQFWLHCVLVSTLVQISIPTWFTVDMRLGCLSIHLETPQCFSAEMYSVDLNNVGKPEEDKVNASMIWFSILTVYYASGLNHLGLE